MIKYSLRRTTPEDAKTQLEVRKKIFDVLEEHKLSADDAISILMTTAVIAVMECTSKEEFDNAYEHLKKFLSVVYNELKEFKEND
jgi:DNA-directed RNA polymerase subunit F